VSAWTVGVSLGVFITLYALLGIVDFVLMRRYARVDPPGPSATEAEAIPAMGY
jgi:cytochrome bd-type quinol oxidase subunit 1